MKKIVSIIMLTALLFTSITNGTTSKAISQYKRITSGNYEYAVLDEANKTATVLKIKPTKEVVIPKIIDGYSIVQIGMNMITILMRKTNIILQIVSMLNLKILDMYFRQIVSQ